MASRILCAVLLCCAVQTAQAIDAVDRLTAERLEAVHQAVMRFKAERRELPRPGPYREYRANLHVHSAFSHDSRGKLEEIVAAAKRAGTQILMFNEHPAPHYDFFQDGHQGLRDGVLLIPGAEMKGLLVFPRQSVKGLDSGEVQAFSDMVRGREGLTFVSHLEERMDWNLSGVTGVEIYNTHADAKGEKRLLTQFRNPFWLLKVAELIRRYPQEAYSALQDYPADYLQRWDQLCERYPHTGVSANDAHQNIGLTIRVGEKNKARIDDALGEKLLEIDAAAITALLSLPKNEVPGSILFELRLDPYENSLRHVATHLLMTELTREALWDALESGRAFVAFDWIADATGFDISAEGDGQRHPMGSRISLTPELKLIGRAPLEARWKLMQNGRVVSESTGSTFAAPLTDAGRFRVELWLNVAGEERLWILSNPFYVTEK